MGSLAVVTINACYSHNSFLTNKEMERKRLSQRRGTGSVLIVSNCKDRKNNFSARKPSQPPPVEVSSSHWNVLQLFLNRMPYLELSVITNSNGLDPDSQGI